MARLKATPERGEFPVPPAEMVAPVVEVWLSADEIGAHSFSDTCRLCAPMLLGHRRSVCADQLLVVARRRWRDYRRRWLDEHGIERRDECRVWPLSSPRWGEVA